MSIGRYSKKTPGRAHGAFTAARDARNAQLQSMAATITALRRENQRLRDELANRANVAPDVASFALALEARTAFTTAFANSDEALTCFARAVEEHKAGARPGVSDVAAWRRAQLRL